jgi:tRNA pseudouridine55 synthase
MLSSSGILNLDKPRGMTSHDVVNLVRRVTGIRKVGHAGTLDPMATGVLLICVGRATRLAEYLTVSEKHYKATVRLGVETDTYDAEGQVTSTRPVSISREEVATVLAEFCGQIAQVPPMYSALKRGGQPLYKLARKGVTVTREPRPAHISFIKLTGWSFPDFSFDVTCSAGTYVRSLAHDLGKKLECGAHLTGLIRSRSGSFGLQDAVPLSDLSSANWKDFLLPMEVAVADLPLLTLDDHAAQCLVHGQAIPFRPEHPVADLARVHSKDGDFFAVARLSEDRSSWLPHKVFPI